MKLDPTVLRTMNKDDFRVLEAVEKGMKDHALVPVPWITSSANLRHGGAHKIISSLLRDKLLSHECRKNTYDGYRVTNAGYDILALHNLKSRAIIAAIGQCIGTGKESDVYLAIDPSGEQVVLKFHRLGRTSFRNVKKKRDYFGKAAQQAHSWLFLSKLSALKEFSFMKALNGVKFPTPTPLAHNRHIVVMSLVRGVPLYQVFPKQLSAEQAADIYGQAIALAARLAKHGLVHCDLNEFNLLVDLSGIQALATASDDPYVRHSGQSIAGEKSVGALSKPAWERH
jgi:RIO kinase 2